MLIDYGFIFEAIEQAKQERADREAYWATLPENEAEQARLKWKVDQVELLKERDHQLRLAEAARPRNFWGQ